MDITIYPGKLRGTVAAIPSKSHAHRALICAAFADKPTRIICPETNRDMEATAACLRALGAKITRNAQGFFVEPVVEIPETPVLPCCDSGSTLRFLLPVAGALGCNARFTMTGRLPERPLSPLWEEMERMGCRLSRPTKNTIVCGGKLHPGEYTIDGGVSSQFLTGLLMAFPLLAGTSTLTVTGRAESRNYVDMTLDTMRDFGVEAGDLRGSQGRYCSPGELTVEGDWSNAAFFLTANHLGSEVAVTGLKENSSQGDRAITEILPKLSMENPVSARDIPDLIPTLSVAAAAGQGGVFTDIRRLRLKESDRVQSILDCIAALGGRAEADENTLRVFGTGLRGGVVDSRNDHRMVMSATIAATACREPVTILGAECVEKSYPEFFSIFASLGGHYEQYLR